MIICKLSDQLGNQMFAYASVKSIALDKGYDFKILGEYNNQFLKNDTDKKYGNTLTSIFADIAKETVQEVPDCYSVYKENITIDSRSDVEEGALKVNDNTLMLGHYISPKYFTHRLKDVQDWFKMPSDIDEKTNRTIKMLKDKYPDAKFCSVHFRNALDYRVKGYMLSSDYWQNAAKKVLDNNISQKIIFLVFYDRYSKLVSSFESKYDCETLHASLLEDFSLISKCDYHIVCNSSFSIMAALMDVKGIDKNTFCPSIWPIPHGHYKFDICPKEWVRVKTGHNTLSFVMGYVAPYLSIFKKFVYKYFN